MKSTRCGLIAVVVALLGASVTASPVPPAARSGPAENRKTLKDIVRLIEADNANEAWSVVVTPGKPVSFRLRLGEARPDGENQADLMVTTFSSQALGSAVSASIRPLGAATGADTLRIVLDAARTLEFQLLLDSPKPGATYKGRLVIGLGTETSGWDVTATIPALPPVQLTIDPIRPLQVVTCSPCRWPLLRSLAVCDGAATDQFVTLHNQSDRPQTHLQAHYEPAAGSGKVPTSNFSLASLRFMAGQCQVDLAGRAETSTVQVPASGQRSLGLQVGHLTPGEYNGALHFSTLEMTDPAQEAKLPLVVQVRHHWLAPLFAILVGTVLGWFGSKYVVALRKTRALLRRLKLLDGRVAAFTPLDMSNRAWHCPGECPSYALSRIVNLLDDLRKLAASATNMLFREEVINETLAEAERRLEGLESVQRVRLRIAAQATGRPAVQIAIGTLLAGMHDVLHRPEFAADQQHELAELRQTALTWVADGSRLRYREALLRRCEGCDQVPMPSDIDRFDHGMGHELLRNELRWLRDFVSQGLPDDASEEVLAAVDDKMARLNLLWRERDMPWADALAAEQNEPSLLSELFAFVDRQVWEHLRTHSSQLTLADNPTAIELGKIVDITIRSRVPHLDANRLRYHPLHVLWQVNDERPIPTTDLTLTRSFDTGGEVRISAKLCWDSEEDIPVEGELQMTVTRTPERAFPYRWAEWATVGVGFLFAAATGISTLYDATFGSFGQYIALLTWAAGAGGGANLFKQLGDSVTVGGKADVTLTAPAPRT